VDKKNRKTTQTGLEIAVIGMAGRFPGAVNIEEFRENLENGVESVTFYTDDELKAAGIDADLLKNPGYVRSGGGVLDDADCFDASFFGYLPGEAEIMDPQCRVFHECAWEAHWRMPGITRMLITGPSGFMPGPPITPHGKSLF